MNTNGSVLPVVVLDALVVIRKIFPEYVFQYILWQVSVLPQKVLGTTKDPGWVNALPPRVVCSLKHLTSFDKVTLPISIVYLDLLVKFGPVDQALEFYVAFSKEGLILVVPPINGFTWVYTTYEVLGDSSGNGHLLVNPFTFEQIAKEG